MNKVTFFQSTKSILPLKHIPLETFLENIKDGVWQKDVLALRAKNSVASFKATKNRLPAVTISGQFKNRDTTKDLSKKLITHTGFICLDIDNAQNPNIRVHDLVDKEAISQFVSCSGKGLKIIYACKKVKTAEEHRRIYDACAERLAKLDIKLNIDPVVKSIASLQYVSYDPEIYINHKTKLVINPLPPIVRKATKPTGDAVVELKQLQAYIDALTKDVTHNYEDWLNLAFGLSYSLKENGRDCFHKISARYPGYSKLECDEKYDSCLERITDKPITIATVYQILGKGIPKPQLKKLIKLYNPGKTTTGNATDPEEADLSDFARYKLFLFKKVIGKKSGQVEGLQPYSINLNAFEKLLKSKGFFRFEKSFVWVVNNIVEEVDINDILRIITEHIENDGDYDFMYKGEPYHFSWEEIVHLWREIRAHNTTYNQINSSLSHWEPNLLSDTATESFIPFQNGVVNVSATSIKILPYNELKQQIWKERILTRHYKPLKTHGMFEEFFKNVTGKAYSRALWYFGYMLQGTKRQSTARAWLLYDKKPGNNGRSGKTIIGNALGHIRNIVVLDGKRLDLKDRFAFQTVKLATEIVFIDDPSKYMSLVPLFNMITGDLSAEGKGSKPVVKKVKFIIASNWILENEGSSESGRQFVTQLDDYYIRYGKEHGDTIAPIVHKHGKEFFTDWNVKDWQEFDNFCVNAIQHHLVTTPPENTIIGNAKVVRFIQLYEEELFYDLCDALHKYSKKGDRSGGLLIDRQALTNVIMEARPQDKVTSAGKLARDYMVAVGAENVGISSANFGGRVKMCYRTTTPLEKLDFAGRYQVGK